jgi:segregation and condensation protein B
LSSLADLPDIAPLLPDIDVIDDLSESLDSEPRFARLNGGRISGSEDTAPALELDSDE